MDMLFARRMALWVVAAAAASSALVVPAAAQSQTAGEGGIIIWTEGFYQDRQSSVIVWGHTTGQGPVTVLALNPDGNIAAVGQTEPHGDGTFSVQLSIVGPYWRHDGVYSVTARAGEQTVPYTIHVGVGDAGCGHGTHLDAGPDGVYCIASENVEEIRLDRDGKSVKIIGSGQVMVEIPRSVLDARGDAGDIPFIVYRGDETIPHSEDALADARIIRMEHPGGAVTVAGTHVIPEFGAVMLALAGGIMLALYGARRQSASAAGA